MIVSDGLLFAISLKNDYNPHPISQYRDQFYEPTRPTRYAHQPHRQRIRPMD